MIYTPPFYLSGEAGKTLGIGGFSLEALGIQGGTLTQRSLAPDELAFSIHAKADTAVPDDNQWLTLRDANGTVMFVGICKRTFKYPARVYDYTATNVYQGMIDTDLIDINSRPYVLYNAQDVALTVRDLIDRAAVAGLPIQAPDPDDMPEFLVAPKMAFRSAKIGSTLEDVMKWAPDVSTRMDYSTTPPTLRFFSRFNTGTVRLDFDSDSNRASTVELAPYPEARALAIAFAYARRDGDNKVQYLIQRAGDDKAESRRKLSVYLSGSERTDLLTSEALTTAQQAMTAAKQALTALSLVVPTASSVSIPFTWSALLPLDSALQAAVAAEPGFTMGDCGGGTVRLYTGINYSGAAWGGYVDSNTTGVYLATTVDGPPAPGWYPIKSGAFTDAQLALAKATKATRYICGQLVGGGNSGSTGLSTLLASSGNRCMHVSGWISGSASSETDANNKYRYYVWYRLSIAVDAINVSPSNVIAAINADISSGTSSIAAHADFVEAPPNLAKDYFARQDWTSYKGTVGLMPSAPSAPAPGDFLNIIGSDLPPEWADMAAPVAEHALDLGTGAATVTIGPSARMDYTQLADRLRIPAEDNYQPAV